MARPRGSLTRDEVLEAALAVIDEEGLDGLTMRRLGQVLGVNHMTPYRLFASRAAIIDALVDREARRFVRDPATVEADPIDRLRGVARHIRSVLLSHPNLAPVVISRPLSRTAESANLVVALRVLREFGVGDEDIARFALALVTYVLGFVLYETGVSRYRATMDEDLVTERARLVETAAHDLADAGDVSIVREIFRDPFGDEQFAFGFDALLDGLLRRVGLAPG